MPHKFLLFYVDDADVIETGDTWKKVQNRMNENLKDVCYCTTLKIEKTGFGNYSDWYWNTK